MKISFEWLKDFIQLDLAPAEVIEKLNSIGLLIDSWEEKGEDAVLELETYANRPDTLGHLGVARELATALGTQIQEQNWPLVESEEEISGCFDVQIWDEDLCLRYCGLIVRGVPVGPSPEWLTRRIQAMGLNPVNNVVDVTNYVLYSTAQPIHAFDLEKLAGGKIIVRRAKKNETLLSLEDKQLDLSSDMLVIADEKKPVALAGIIGGLDSSVTEKTKDIFIESAYFDPISIRKTWKKFGVQTDASYRFERGADISFSPKAALMAASLLTQMGGKALKGMLDVYPKPRKHKTVVLRQHRIRELLGVEVETDFVTNTLSNLQFQLEEKQPGIWRIQVPYFRVDIEREADLIEEIARFYGYDNIPAVLPAWAADEPGIDPVSRIEENLRQSMFNHGFDEVVNYSFSDEEKNTVFMTGKEAVEIRNPISARAGQLRTTLISGLLENIVWNKNRGVEGVHIFEVGNVYFWKDEKCREQKSLALATFGVLETPHWQSEVKDTDFFHLKGACEDLLSRLGFVSPSFQKEDHALFETGHSLSLSVKGKQIGWLGSMKPEALNAFDLREPVWAAEMNLAELLAMQTQSFVFAPLNRFPHVVRDISFLVERHVIYQDLKESIERLDIAHLQSFTLYDRYSGKSIPKDKISLSLRFIFQHPRRTLLAEEVDNLIEKIIKALKSSFKFQLREGGEN
jgi:phenylalanyl-tRNA synthetase beta chain